MLGPIHPRDDERIRRVLGVPADFPITQQDVWDATTGHFDRLLLQARMPQTGGRWRFHIGGGTRSDAYRSQWWWSPLEDPGMVDGAEWRCVADVEHINDLVERGDRSYPPSMHFEPGHSRYKVRVGPFKDDPRIERDVQLFNGLFVPARLAAVSDDGTLEHNADFPRAKVQLVKPWKGREWAELVIEPTSRDGREPVMELRHIDRTRRPVEPRPVFLPTPPEGPQP